MVFGSNWTQVGPKFLSKRLVVSGLGTIRPEPIESSPVRSISDWGCSRLLSFQFLSQQLVQKVQDSLSVLEPERNQ
jgi:hypothetical protein